MGKYINDYKAERSSKVQNKCCLQPIMPLDSSNTARPSLPDSSVLMFKDVICMTWGITSGKMSRNCSYL